LVDEGYRCSECYTAGADLNGKETDFCSKCHLQFHMHCAKHRKAQIASSSAISDGRVKNHYPVHYIQLGLELFMGLGRSLTCMSCGEDHDIVLSYLNPMEMDLHMRPVRGAQG
jgi:hypothetical protein